MSSPAARERQCLVEALLEAGAHAPTLCEGWTAHDLAVHLVLRERRPDAALAMAVPFLSGHADRVRRAYEAEPFAALVEMIRTGPPRTSPFALPKVDQVANLAEHFVHCEDVRRGRPGWEPRVLDEDVEEALWRLLSRMARLTLRRSPVPTRLVRPDGAEIATGGSGIPVRLNGAPGELLLYSFGRTSACRVELTGPEEAVAAFREVRLQV